MKRNKFLRLSVCFILALSLIISMGVVGVSGDTEWAEGEGACTAFYMGKDTTENGSYIWGRSEDISASYTKLFQVHEAEGHAPGDMYVSGDWDASFETFTPMFTWPYPERTLRYILCSDSIYNERQDPEPYAEVGMNEKGVCLSSTVSLSRCKSQISALDPRVSRYNGGLAETDVASVVLMQAETAREACELVAKIIDTVGASGREGLMVSDPNEVWFFQWLSGHQYIAVKCPDDMIGFSPNITGNVGDAEGWTDLTDTENVIASPGLVSVAKQAGVLVSKDDDTKIKIADTYSSRTANYREGRMRVGYGYLYGYTTNEEIDANLPDVKYLDFFQEPRQDGKYSLYEAMRLLACRGEGTEWEGSSGIGRSSTIEAHVFEVRPDMPFDLAQIEWISLAPPEFGVYLPYYGNLVTEVFEKCYSPDPNPRVYDNNDPDNNSMYWVFRELHTQCAATDLPTRERFGNGVRAFWERYQKSLIEQQAYVDDAMTKVLAKEGLEVVEWVATNISMQLAEQTYDYAKQILAELKAFKAAGTEGAFVPSVLADEDAIPNYVDLILLIIDIKIDIKPGSDPNSINLESKGVVPVAVLTTDDFDASNVDPETVEFAGAEPVRWTMDDVDGDGDVDMLFHFKTQELDLDEDSTEATLIGTTDTGWVIGTDTVNIVPTKD